MVVPCGMCNFPDQGSNMGPLCSVLTTGPAGKSSLEFRKMPETEGCVSSVAQSCPTLCDPVDCSPPGSSVHGVLQGRILEGVTISSSRGSSWSREWTGVSCIVGRFFTIWATTCMVKSFCCPTEITTILLTGYIPIPKKKKKSEQLNFIECTGIRCKSGNFSCTVCILF